MNAKVIISLCFLVISIVITVLCFTVLRKKKYGKFVGASSAAYASGCFFIFMLALLKENAPLIFVILADSLVTGVFVFTAVMLILVSTKIVEGDKPS
ncbi:MAG: hypothetical protein J5752_06595 [Clostridiales bacterium]|nr:hypothetical protein [Clostridiales bacterium]